MRKVPSIILSKIIGIIVFLLILFILNIVTLDLEVYRLWVMFLNNNAVLIILMSIFFMMSEVFYVLVFPFSLISPIFSAVAAMYLVSFIFKIFSLMDYMMPVQISLIFNPIGVLIYPFVFLGVLIGCYIHIFVKLVSKKEKKHIKSKKQDSKDDTGKKVKKEISSALRNLADSIDKK